MDVDAGTVDTAVAAHLAREPRIRVMAVEYLHLQLADGSDLYLTEYGRPFGRQLLPENHWADKAWIAEHSVKLRGTSTLYRIVTKEVAGTSKEIVLKWNRMGQDIPGATQASDLGTAKFNSPFEEFSLVMELRNTRYEAAEPLYTQKPLAIYVPREYVEAERLGRRGYRIEAIQQKHDEITLDRNRQYAVMYEWVKGIDAAQARGEGIVDDDTMRGLILRSNREMKRKGFVVRDSKAHHVIVRPKDERGPLRGRGGAIVYAMVDFELLQRTPQREQAMRAVKRQVYLVKQAHRFESAEDLPGGLTQVTIMGVEYVYGQVASTGGRLWVVGRDPALFEYFLPEKWRKTPRTQLSASHRTYHTITKDAIHLVWWVSHVGGRPRADMPAVDEQAVLDHGYNSPFEEIALSMALTRSGMDTTYPRAIYMTGRKSAGSVDVEDDSRYISHEALRTPEGHPVLGRRHDHILIWGYWNGPDEVLAAKDEQIYTGIDASAALGEGRITEEEYTRVMESTRRRLADAGIEDLNPTGRHVLLSLDRSGRLVAGPEGMPMVRICNFELLRRVGSAELPT